MKFRNAVRLSFLVRGFLAVTFICLSLQISAPAATVLYATGGGSGHLSALYSIDPTTGAATALQQFDVYLYAGGLAYDAITDTLYAVGATIAESGTSRLFVINRFTGALTTFPGMSPTINLTSGGLAINPVTGIMYATGGNGFQSTGLFTIDKNTGAATLVGQAGGQCCTAPFGFNIYGLGFRSDGTLFANGLLLADLPGHPTDSILFTLDLASGLATEVGHHGVDLGRQLTYSGLAFGTNGTLYSLGSTSASAQGLYTVNPATGAATLIGETIIQFGVDGGLAFAPDQPVPQPVALNIGVAGVNTLRLAWPTNVVNSLPYVLHESTNFNPATWTVITNVPVYSGGTGWVVLPFPSTTTVYRLKTL